MNLEFICSGENPSHKSEFLRHMEDLQNIKFEKEETFLEVMDKLKIKNNIDIKINAINDFIQFNDKAKTMKAEEVFGVEFGYATFNFKKDN